MKKCKCELKCPFEDVIKASMQSDSDLRKRNDFKKDLLAFIEKIDFTNPGISINDGWTISPSWRIHNYKRNKNIRVEEYIVSPYFRSVSNNIDVIRHDEVFIGPRGFYYDFLLLLKKYLQEEEK